MSKTLAYNVKIEALIFGQKMSKMAIVMCTEARGIYLCAFRLQCSWKEGGREDTLCVRESDTTDSGSKAHDDGRRRRPGGGGKASQIGHSTS